MGSMSNVLNRMLDNDAKIESDSVWVRQVVAIYEREVGTHRRDVPSRTTGV
jgi:hypothetical protein